MCSSFEVLSAMVIADVPKKSVADSGLSRGRFCEIVASGGFFLRVFSRIFFFEFLLYIF